MFWNKKDEPSPLGVPLGDLMVMLQPTSIKASLKGNTLTARHEHYTIRIEVVPPETRESENGPIRAVVRMITELPKPILTLFQGKEAEATAAYNAFAALGSLCADRGNVYIGSRLTIYEAEDSWRTLHLPLLMFTTICGTEAILGALGLVKQAKVIYERAIGIDGGALEGSAYNSLGVLYYKVPGWPVGFGDKAKAKELLLKALALNPKGIDPNFFYGEYLVETGHADEAVVYLERALQAPPRAGRQIADTGRREEVRALLAKLKSH